MFYHNIYIYDEIIVFYTYIYIYYYFTIIHLLWNVIIMYIYISYIDPDNWYVISTDDIGHQPQQPHQAPAASGLRCLQPGRIPSMTSTIPKLIPHNLLKYHSPTAKKMLWVRY